MATRPYARFLFSRDDQARIITDEVHVRDLEPRKSHVRGLPQSMELAFRVSQPERGAPELRPLLHGTLYFQPDGDAPGILPTPEQVDLAGAAYPQWRTRGTLHVVFLDTLKQNKGVWKALRQAAGDLDTVPNQLWYGPVVLTRDFLLQTLIGGDRDGLRRGDIAGPGGRGKLTGDTWKRHAVSNFLAGRYGASLRVNPTDPDLDDSVRFRMPTVDMQPDGTVKLVVSAALGRDPLDGGKTAFDGLTSIVVGDGVSRGDPRHLRNGRIPPRHVYRAFGTGAIDASGSALLDRMVAPPEGAAVFHPIHFTRTWKPITEPETVVRDGGTVTVQRIVPNCSILFPTQTVVVTDPAGTVMVEDALPAHGVVYVPYLPTAQLPDPPAVTVRIQGGLTWLDGHTPRAWRIPAADAPITLSLAPSLLGVPNVVVRGRMNEAVMADTTRPEVNAAACTYFSLRRSLRALIDHRITGGMMAAALPRRSPHAERLMAQAWSSLEPGIDRPDVHLLARNGPSVKLPPEVNTPEEKRTWLREQQAPLVPILSAFHPEPANPAPDPGERSLTEGRAAYSLWQTLVHELADPALHDNFDPFRVGRGAPGALLALDLAEYRFDPTYVGTDDDAYGEWSVIKMVNSKLQPGDVLQFWNREVDFSRARSRQNVENYGHSPIFHGYHFDENTGELAGIDVIDQYGTTFCPLVGAPPGKVKIRWGTYDWGVAEQDLYFAQVVWIAAGWKE